MNESSLTQRAARMALLAMAFAVIASLRSPAMPAAPPGSAAVPGATDARLFENIVKRLQASTPYYVAVRDEMTAFRYPTSSPFNWRTPVLYQVVALIGLTGAWWLLAALCVCTILLAYRTLEPALDAGALLLGLLAILGCVLFALSPVMLLQTEVWCGLFIALSALAVARDRKNLGVGLGIAALFIRELAAPYCVACTVASLRARRFGEAGAWIVGGVGYLCFYAWHVIAVAAHQDGASSGAHYSWLQWLGLPFLLTTVRESNSVLLTLPRAATAIYAGLVWLAVFSPRLPQPIKAGVLVYSVFFLIVGQPFNDYWGGISGPLLAMASAFGPSGVLVLWRTAR